MRLAHYIPAVEVADVVDQTGAGNTYCGGFLVGYCRERDIVGGRLLWRGGGFIHARRSWLRADSGGSGRGVAAAAGRSAAGRSDGGALNPSCDSCVNDMVYFI